MQTANTLIFYSYGNVLQQDVTAVVHLCQEKYLLPDPLPVYNIS